ncbi:MAG TPA: MBL fold metallo-hydrolase [Sporichthyaceae bacterium]
MDGAPDTTIDEIAQDIFRIATFVRDIGPTGFTFHQFLIRAEQPLLFHCGHRAMFPLVSAAVSTVLPVESLRWITFDHLEADESGGMNAFLAAAPQAEVAHGAMGCMVSLNDLADRPPRPLADGEVIDLGGKRVRHLDTPHVPHGWDARLLYEEVTGTLFCSDLFAHLGRGPAVTESDVVEPADAAETMFRGTSLTPDTAPTIRRLAELNPTTLAIMHGSSFSGDCAGALHGLADRYAVRHAAACGA